MPRTKFQEVVFAALLCFFMVLAMELYNTAFRLGGMSNACWIPALMELRQKELAVGVYRLPKRLDEEVARLHLDNLGVELTRLTRRQADYIGVPEDGPYKAEHYRY